MYPNQWEGWEKHYNVISANVTDGVTTQSSVTPGKFMNFSKFERFALHIMTMGIVYGLDTCIYIHIYTHIYICMCATNILQLQFTEAICWQLKGGHSTKCLKFNEIS